MNDHIHIIILAKYCLARFRSVRSQLENKRSDDQEPNYDPFLLAPMIIIRHERSLMSDEKTLPVSNQCTTEPSILTFDLTQIIWRENSNNTIFEKYRSRSFLSFVILFEIKFGAKFKKIQCTCKYRVSDVHQLQLSNKVI